MKNLTTLCALLLCLSCVETKKQEVLTSDFDFLLGDWERTNTKPGIITKEHWTIRSRTQYVGHGYTLEKGDTIFQEYMRLTKEKDLWTLEVEGPNEDPVPFEVTGFATNEFTAQNPTNQFPTTIFYSYFDDTLSAKVSNDTQELRFIFWREE